MKSNNPTVAMISIFVAIVAGSFVAVKTASNFRPERSGDRKEKGIDFQAVQSRLWEDPRDALLRIESEVPEVSVEALKLLQECVRNYSTDTKLSRKVVDTDFPFQIFIYESGPQEPLVTRVKVVKDLLGKVPSGFEDAISTVLKKIESEKSSSKENLGWTRVVTSLMGDEEKIEVQPDKKGGVKRAAHPIALETILEGILDLKPPSEGLKEDDLTQCKNAARSMLVVLQDAKIFWAIQTRGESKDNEDINLKNLRFSLKYLRENKSSQNICATIADQLGKLMKAPTLANPIFVMFPGDDNAEDKEGRIRIRRAVLRAMMDKEYFPESNKSLALLRVQLPNSNFTKYFLFERFVKGDNKRDIVYVDESHLLSFSRQQADGNKQGQIKIVESYLDKVRDAAGLGGQPANFIGPYSSDTAFYVQQYTKGIFLTPFATAVSGQGSIKQLICSDEAYSKAIKNELELRGFSQSRDKVLLVCEGDSEFGQKFPETFRKIFEVKQGERDPIADLRYVRGTDGGLVKTAISSGGKAGAERSVNEWPPQGPHQFDDLARIAENFSADKNIRAIGVVGTDTYDKLVIIQIFHPWFPQAIFFTTDLDVEFLRKELRGVMQGVVVASANDLSPDESHKNSFRDSFQSGVYKAVNKVLEGDVSSVPPPAHLFEVSRSSLLRLKEVESDSWKGLSGNNVLAIRIGALFFAVIMAFLSWNNFLHGKVFLGIVTMCFVLVPSLVLWFLSDEPGGGLPAIGAARSELLSGISVWLSEAVRFLGIGLSGAVLWYLFRHTGFKSSNTRAMNEPFFSLLNSSGEVEMISAWIMRNTSPNRLKKEQIAKWVDWFLNPVPLAILLFFFVLIMVYSCTFGCSSFPTPPARGWAAFAGDGLALGSLIASFYFLSALSLLGTLRIYHRLRDFDDFKTGASQRKKIPNSELKQWLSGKFLELQKEMEAYSSLIFPPFVLLLFTILARNSLVESWGMSWLMALLFLFMATILFIMAILQSRWASDLKSRMQEEVWSLKISTGEKEALEKALPLLDRGLFAGWIGGNALQAALVPLGGSSAFYGLEYLTGLFG